jgi:hypothetical protein
MHSTFERIRIAALLAALAAPTCLRADEAVLPNGMRFQGILRAAPQGRFSFQTESRTFNLSHLYMVRFADTPPRPRTAGAVHRITLSDGQHLSSELIELSTSVVRIQPAWADKPLSIPRSAVLSISQSPGEITLLDEDFETDLAAWKTRGEPELSERQSQSGHKSLLMSTPGQKLEYVPTRPVEAGRLALSYFADLIPPVGARWVMDLEFAGKESPERVSLELAGRGTSSALTVPFNPARWRRLVLEWRRDSLIVQIDGAILHQVNRKASGALRTVRLRCLNGPAAVVLGGEVWIDDLRLTRFVDDLPRPPQEPEQDAIWLADGDQLFGTVLGADRRTIQLQSRSGERTLAWADVRAIHLRRQSSPIRSSIGEHVKIRLGEGNRLDELHGVLTSLDDRKLAFQHPVLGALSLDRGWLRQMQGRFFGRRIELDDAPHHLGQHLLPESPRPEGMSLRRTFTIPAVPSTARLQVTVAHMPAAGDEPAVARMLARGGLRTEVVLNGRVIDYLNRHATRTSSVPQIITITLPASVLRAGDNVLELRQTVDSESGRSADCVISGLLVDMPG